MSVVTVNLEARWGNSLFKYAFARAYAEKVGAELQTTPWIGQKIFRLSDPPIERQLPDRYDMDLEKWDGETDINLTGWGLHQKCLIYSRSQVREWFTFQTRIEEAVARIPHHELAAHLRHGDFVTMEDYVAISRTSYMKACRDFNLPVQNLIFVSEDRPAIIPVLEQGGIGFLADFVRLMRAKVLLRANSTFSFWAGILGENERIFAPKLDEVLPVAGITQAVPFVEGNYPAISCVHPNCSDLHLR